MEKVTYKSPLHQTVSTTKTDYWNDSCSVEELTYGIEHGAVGATTNPSIVHTVLKKEVHLWRDRIYQVIADNPTWNEDQIMWQIFEEVAVHGAELLRPVFERTRVKRGASPSRPTRPFTAMHRHCRAGRSLQYPGA